MYRAREISASRLDLQEARLGSADHAGISLSSPDKRPYASQPAGEKVVMKSSKGRQTDEKKLMTKNFTPCEKVLISPQTEANPG